MIKKEGTSRSNVELRFEFGETKLVIGDGQLVFGIVFELEKSLWIRQVLLEANGLVVATIVEKLHAVAQRRTLHLHLLYSLSFLHFCFLFFSFSLIPQIRVIIITFIRTVTKAPHFLLGTPPIFVKSSSYPSHLTQSLLSIAEQSMSYESMEAVDRQLGSGIVLKQEVMCIADWII